MERSYFHPRESKAVKSELPAINQQSSGSVKVTMQNITNDEVEYITSQDTQYNQAILSIEKRCTMFHRRYPDRRIKKQVMTKVMKQAGLRKKKVNVRNVPHNGHLRQAEFA